MRKGNYLISCLWILILAIAMLTGCGGQGKAETTAQTRATTQSESILETEPMGEEETQSPAEPDTEAASPADTETQAFADTEALENGESALTVEEDGVYTSKEEVALYLHTYGRLPSNYVTKKEAQAAGWDNKKGNLQEVIPGASIGGDRFGNYEGLLPDKSGRKYYECDIDYEGGYRGAKRIIYSNDGLIFYTEDHYESFEPLYE